MPRKPAQPLPVQERSRESLRRILDAAEVVLARYGLEGAILQRIASQAEQRPLLTPGLALGIGILIGAALLGSAGSGSGGQSRR